ncbi:hypothetical protein HYV84_08435, partial [Candidatus Woesearchaeota archaeon]|nr:hypothetical protein [Candidatus Woesearchaeota archaeon]
VRVGGHPFHILRVLEHHVIEDFQAELSKLDRPIGGRDELLLKLLADGLRHSTFGA